MPLTIASSVGVEKFKRKHWVLSLSCVIKAEPGTTATLLSTATWQNVVMSTLSGRAHQMNRPPSGRL